MADVECLSGCIRVDDVDPADATLVFDGVCPHCEGILVVDFSEDEVVR